MPIVHDDLASFQINLVADAGEVLAVFLEDRFKCRLELSRVSGLLSDELWQIVFQPAPFALGACMDGLHDQIEDGRRVRQASDSATDSNSKQRVCEVGCLAIPRGRESRCGCDALRRWTRPESVPRASIETPNPSFPAEADPLIR